MMRTVDVQPGDVVDVATGINRVVERFVVHNVHRYETGALSVRARYVDAPRGIDWSLFVKADEPTLTLVARGVARVDDHVRSLLQ